MLRSLGVRISERQLLELSTKAGRESPSEAKRRGFVSLQGKTGGRGCFWGFGEKVGGLELFRWVAWVQFRVVISFFWGMKKKRPRGYCIVVEK